MHRIDSMNRERATAILEPKKFEFLAQTPLIITFYCIFKL